VPRLSVKVIAGASYVFDGLTIIGSGTAEDPFRIDPETIEGTPGPAGEDGEDGATGATGPAGPAPAGTGFVHVTGGVLDTPADIAVDGTTISGSGYAGSPLTVIGTGIIPASAIYGDGLDGPATFDGATAVAGCSRVGSTYTATRTLYITDAAFSVGVTLFAAAFPVNVNGRLTVIGAGTATIHCNGTNASGATGGTVALNGFLQFGRGGGNGGSNAIGQPGGNSATTSWNGRCSTNSAANGGAIATPGGVGPVAFRGGGGGGGATTNAGGIGGSSTQPTAASGGPRLEMLQVGAAGSTTFTALTNGSGGGGGAGGAAGTGGGGGQGGGYLLCNIREIEVPVGSTLLLQANGGSGAAGTGTGGGGGGGGGGHNVLFNAYMTGTITQQVSGGTGGAGGTGAAGGDGAVGATYYNPNL
jgi:hypothetical protein